MFEEYHAIIPVVTSNFRKAISSFRRMTSEEHDPS